MNPHSFSQMTRKVQVPHVKSSSVWLDGAPGGAGALQRVLGAGLIKDKAQTFERQKIIDFINDISFFGKEAGEPAGGDHRRVHAELGLHAGDDLAHKPDVAVEQ